MTVKPVLRLTGSGQKREEKIQEMNVLKGRRRCFRPGERVVTWAQTLPRWLPAWGVNYLVTIVINNDEHWI